MPARLTPPAHAELDVIEVARALADLSRVAMLDALLDGRAHLAGALAKRAGVTAATASSHVTRLAKAGLVSVERRGRFHWVQLAGPEAGELLERMHAASSAASAPPAGARAELRLARTCYDHLAGVLGVRLAAALLERGWLTERDADFAAAAPLLAWLEARGWSPGVGARRPLARACLDGTERAFHLAGAAGAALASVLIEDRWLARRRDSRSLRITEHGRRQLVVQFGLRLSG
jgi:DNA-binding transcriptional ArsR family regulator